MDEPQVRRLSRGRCFVYLLPCREQDTQKLGFARDPWQRMQSFHPRFHQVFDLGRGALIETDTVADAREIECALKAQFADARWPAPLLVRQRAGGGSEWFCGIDAAAMAAMREIAAETGYALHTPLAPWLHLQWLPQLAQIADWIRHRFEWIEWLHFTADARAAEPVARALRDRIGAWDAIGLPLQARLSPREWEWYRHDCVF
jgi:hypothetical protein